jgi:hypothetical protein
MEMKTIPLLHNFKLKHGCSHCCIKSYPDREYLLGATGCSNITEIDKVARTPAEGLVARHLLFLLPPCTVSAQEDIMITVVDQLRIDHEVRR